MNRAKMLLLVGAMVGLVVMATAWDSRRTVESAETTPGIHLIASDANAIVVELVVDQFEIESVVRNGENFHSVAVAGMQSLDAPGQPQLPTQGVLLGVPTDQNVTVRILDAESTVVDGYRVEPAPAFQRTVETDDPSVAQALEPVFAFDQTFYATDALYPATPAAVMETGFLRDQAFAQLQFNPVQFNPATGELRTYTRLRVAVTWDAAAAGAQKQPAVVAPEFEETLQAALLNYAELDRPQSAERSSDTMQPVSATSGPPTALNVRVHDSGVYKLTHTDFSNAGVDPTTVDPRTIKLHNRGVELSIRVTGQSDGTFDPGDLVIFYGAAYEDLYTKLNNYVVTWGGANGARMASIDGTPASATIPQNFRATKHAEVNNTYWWDMGDGHGQDHWFWQGRIGALIQGIPALRDYTVTLPPLANSSGATLRVALRGYTSLNHGTNIYLNGNLIDSQIWSGQALFVHTIALPDTLLLSGDNTVTVEAYDGGSGSHQLYTDWIEVDYNAAYQSTGDVIAFAPPTGAGTKLFELTQFSSSSVEAFDITHPETVGRIINGTTTATGSTWKYRFQTATSAESRFIAVTTAQYKTPDVIEGYEPTDWQSPTHGADYIIITPAYLAATIAPLAAQRTSDGLRVATVEIADIYNEFNDGIANPQAVRDFLAYAHDNWVAPAPLYVLLVGDATYDYKNNLGATVFREMVPTQIIEADHVIDNEGQAPSDNWLAAFSGSDVLPDVYIGRLPMSDAVFLTNHVNKIIDYTQNPPDSSWDTNALFVADDDTVIDFEAYSASIQAKLPTGYTINTVYAGDYVSGVNTTADITNDIIAAIDAGSLLVHYTGHGNVERWGSWAYGGNFWHRYNVVNLSNTDKYPFVTIGDCLNGYFIAADNRSMAEAFVFEPNIGAVAVWAPSWLGYSNGHTQITQHLYDAFFDDALLDLGAATTAAKIDIYASSTAWSEMVETYTLFGDPYTELGAQIDPPKVISKQPANGATNVALDQAIRVTFDREMNTSSVTLSGVPGMTFTPAWDSSGTSVTFSHSNFTHGALLTLTVNGQDRFGNSVDPTTNTWSFTVTTDSTPPDATIGVEGGALTDVPLDASITMTFTEIVRSPSVQYSISPPISGSLTWETLGTVVRFDHDKQAFVPGQTYTFSVNDAIDQAGNHMSMPRSITFTATVIDTLPPQVDIGVEGGQTYDVPLDATITMTFTESMNTSTVVHSLTPPKAGVITWDATDRIATFTPSGQYAANQTYTFAVESGEDLAGNPLAGAPVELVFTTLNTDNQAPTVGFNVSGGNPAQTALNATLELDFSELMNTSSVTAILTPGNAGLPMRSWSGSTLTLDYPLAFAPNTQYTLQVGGTDLAGNPLTGVTAFTFTTVSTDVTPPTGVISISGNPPLDDVPTSSQILVTFSEAMNTSTVAASLSPSVPFAAGWNASNTVLTLTPVGGLAFDTAYTVTVAAGAEDVAGNGMAAPISLMFTTTGAGAVSVSVFMPVVLK